MGAKLALMQPINALAFKSGFAQLTGLVLLEVAMYAINDYWSFAPSAVFNQYGISAYWLSFGLFLLAGFVVCHLVASRYWLNRLYIMVLAPTLFVGAIYFVSNNSLWHFPWYVDSIWHWGVWGIQIIWLVIVVGRVIHLLFKLPSPMMLYLTSVFMFFAYVVFGVFTQQQFFTHAYREDDANLAAQTAQSKLDVESTFYKQPSLIANAVANLTPQREGKADLYFVGFAGQADEKVFANEVTFAQNLFDTRYDTKGHSIALLNSYGTFEKSPIATAHNLADTLNGVAKRMNVDEDILFLFLSSHGSKKFNLSVSFYPLPLNDLSADELKKILDESGIKNRVIVVSACYSGGFIDALKNDNTLILTAARRDRTSFGCGVESEFTYFGDAFFVQALSGKPLPQQGLKQQGLKKLEAQQQAALPTFMQAFGQAKTIIATREKLEQLTNKPSEPQVFEGNAIKPKLDAWYEQIKAH